MAKIVFWSSGETDACTFYRCAEPARVLRALGHEAVSNYQAGLADLMIADVVVIQRPTEVGPRHIMEKLLSLPTHTRPRIVVELDDDLFGLPEHHPAHPMMADAARRYRLKKALDNADRVTVTNNHLGTRVRYENAWQLTDGRIRVVPNYVPERFVVDRVPQLDAIGTPTITWAGSDTHRRDFDEVAVALRKLLRARDDFRVRIVGAPYAARLRTALGADLGGRGGARVQQVPWVEGVDRYIPTLAGHIGLAPLADDLFNRSKSDLRLKELAARGMAVVPSDVGPYQVSDVPKILIGQRLGVFGDWYQVLGALFDDPQQRGMFAERALDWAQTNTLEAHADQWEKALLD